MLRNHAPHHLRQCAPTLPPTFLRRDVHSAKTARMPLPLQQVVSWQRALAPALAQRCSLPGALPLLAVGAQRCITATAAPLHTAPAPWTQV
jgi:hypothetical protein